LPFITTPTAGTATDGVLGEHKISLGVVA
jgi:hypothetical protein